MRIPFAFVLLACSSPREPVTQPEERGSNTIAVTDAAPPAPAPRGKWKSLVDPFLATRVHGSERKCAVARDGRVACWGALDGQGIKRLEGGSPQLLDGVTDAVDVVSLMNAVCVLRRDGTGCCVATSDQTSLPASFSAAEISSRQQNLCVRLRDGRVGCYEDDFRAPAPKLDLVQGITGATSMTCMDDGCCVTIATTSVCFAPEVKPLAEAPASAKQLAYHSFGGCALTTGAVCWGEVAALSRPKADAVVFFDRDPCVLEDGKLHCKTGVVDNVATANHDCVVYRDGTVGCVGMNRYGELGDGRPPLFTTPQRVPDLENVVELRVTNTQICAMRRDREVTCWGWAPRKNLGKASAALAAGNTPSCWIAGSTLHCHEIGALAPGEWKPPRSLALPLRGPITAYAIANSTLCAVAGGKLQCLSQMFRDDEAIQVTTPPIAEIDDYDEGLAIRLTDGRIGYVPTDDEITPASFKLLELRDATKLVSGNYDLCVIEKSGDVRCVGQEKGEKPAVVPEFHGATAIAAHAFHRCAIIKNELWCGGRNSEGQLGRGALHEDPQPIARVELPFKPIQVGVMQDGTCVLADTGHVWCWGSDRNGELGQGRLRSRATLGKVVGLGPR